MSDVDNTVQPQESEREALELRAKQLGIKFHPNLSDEKLRERVTEELNKPTEGVEGGEVSHAPVNKGARNEALALKRVRITCMNPNKKDWEGEVFCAGNSQIGTVRKMVPFEAEFHVPDILLKMIKRRQYQTFVTVKTPNGGKVKRGKLVREFAVEELEPLSEKELAELKQRQLMAAGQAE